MTKPIQVGTGANNRNIEFGLSGSFNGEKVVTHEGSLGLDPKDITELPLIELNVNLTCKIKSEEKNKDRDNDWDDDDWD